MNTMRYPDHLEKLIQILKKLPGVGHKSAERFAFHMLDWPKNHLLEMGQTIIDVKEKLQCCKTCGCLLEKDPCRFCDKEKRENHIICIVASIKDVFLIEQTGEYRGHYHVLGGLLSPISGFAPESLRLPAFKQRLKDLPISEVVLALDATLEGDATALFLKKELESNQVSTSRLALGLPMGSALDYIDEGTLARAFAGRRSW